MMNFLIDVAPFFFNCFCLRWLFYDFLSAFLTTQKDLFVSLAI